MEEMCEDCWGWRSFKEEVLAVDRALRGASPLPCTVPDDNTSVPVQIDRGSALRRLPNRPPGRPIIFTFQLTFLILSIYLEYILLIYIHQLAFRTLTQK